MINMIRDQQHNILCFRLVETSSSAVSLSPPSSNGYQYCFHSYRAFRARESVSGASKTVKYSRSSLNVESIQAASVSELMVSERSFHKIRNWYSFSRRPSKAIRSILCMHGFSFLLEGIGA